MVVDLCSFLALKGSWGCLENEEASFLECWGLCFLLCPPPPRMHRASLCCFCFHVIIWITKERRKMDLSPFISWHQGQARTCFSGCDSFAQAQAHKVKFDSTPVGQMAFFGYILPSSFPVSLHSFLPSTNIPEHSCNTKAQSSAG